MTGCQGSVSFHEQLAYCHHERVRQCTKSDVELAQQAFSSSCRLLTSASQGFLIIATSLLLPSHVRDLAVALQCIALMVRAI
jgi:hypothetical protein